MTTDPTAGGTTDPTATHTDQQQIDAALTQAEQAIADLTNRVSTDLQSLRDQIANAHAQGTLDVTEIVNRIDKIVVNVQGVDPSVVLQGGGGGPLPPTGGAAPAAEGVAGTAGQTPAGATAEASDAAPEGEAASGEQGEQVGPEGGPSAGQ